MKSMQMHLCKVGGGAAMKSTTTGEKWSSTESQLHINALELLAVFYEVRSFKETMTK